MALDYSDTGHFLALGNELSILETPRRLWGYTRKINSSWPGSGNPYFKSVLNTIYVNTAQASDDVETASKTAMKDGMEEEFRSIHENRRAILEGENGVLQYLAKAMSLDQQIIDEGPIFYQYDGRLLGETGQVSILRRGGILGALARQMAADSETIRTNGVVLGAVTAKAGNTGTLAENTVGGGRSHAFSGTITLKCVDDTVGRTQLLVTHLLDEPLADGTQTLEAENQVTVETDFEDGPTGLSLQMRYNSILEAGDAGDILSAFDWANPNEDDSDKGKIYIRITRLALLADPSGSFLIEAFSSGDMEDEDLLGSDRVVVITGSVGIAISCPGGSSISATFDADAADTALPDVDDEDDDITFDLRVPRFGDEWTKTVTNDEAGVFATKIGKTWRASLEVATNPAQTIPDTLAPNFTIAA